MAVLLVERRHLPRQFGADRRDGAGFGQAPAGRHDGAAQHGGLRGRLPRPARGRAGARPRGGDGVLGWGLAFGHLAVVTLAGLVVLRRLGRVAAGACSRTLSAPSAIRRHGGVRVRPRAGRESRHPKSGPSSPLPVLAPASDRGGSFPTRRRAAAAPAVRRAPRVLLPMSSGKSRPTPIPQAPWMRTVTSMRRGTKPPATGWPLSGATTNQSTRVASRPRPSPSSHIGARGSRGSARPKARPYSPAQKQKLTIRGTPKGGTGSVG